MADRVLYVDPTLRQMRDALENDGLAALLECIMEETDSIGSEADVTILLAQDAPDMLRSILLNTLPADVASGRVILEPWTKISLKSQQEDELEPGLYINYLAPRDGSPLNLAEFSRFLEGLEAAVWGTILPHCGSARNVHSACKEQYRFKAPALLNLARCVLGALFPDKHFRLFNYCLFRAFTASQLAVGQSIAPQLTASSGEHGGFNFTAHEDLDAPETETEKEPEVTESEWMTVCDRDITLLDKFNPLLAESCRHRRFGVLMQLRIAVQAFDEKLDEDIKQLEVVRLEHRQNSYTAHFTASYRQQLESLDQEMIAHQALKLLTAEEGEKIDRALDDLSSRFTEAGCEAEMQRLTSGLFPGRSP
ncbi:hypothetical protein KCU65_g1936, partial [Aureobasidium melanogenum]